MAAALALGALWLLARSIRAARRHQRELDELKDALAEARGQYESEVKWRSVDERLRLASESASRSAGTPQAPQ